MPQRNDMKAMQQLIEQRAKRLVALKLDGIPRPMINAKVAAVLDGLDDDTSAAVLHMAEEIIEQTLPYQHNRPRFR
jgi:hypothetical protein